MGAIQFAVVHMRNLRWIHTVAPPALVTLVVRSDPYKFFASESKRLYCVDALRQEDTQAVLMVPQVRPPQTTTTARVSRPSRG